jgi:very-short-patch-repair endonuclease
MTNLNQVFNKTAYKKFRRKLRHKLTPAEATLWRYLKNKQLENRRFRRQFGVDKYVLDFYCPSEKLAVELDGKHHYSEEGMAYDSERDQFLVQQGIKVIRFENVEVFENINGVLDKIKSCFKRSR